MTINKRKKNSRLRGSKTHGWGAMKKHRGAGNRGGRGMAGSGKRADQKKPTILKLYGPSYFGKKGFTLPTKLKRKIKAINISYLEENFNKLLKKDTIKKDGDSYLINLKDLGFNKLLAKGTPSKKFKIITKYHSKKALEKIKKANGEIINEG